MVVTFNQAGAWLLQIYSQLPVVTKLELGCYFCRFQTPAWIIQKIDNIKTFVLHNLKKHHIAINTENILFLEKIKNMNKRQIINKIKELEGLSKEEKNYLVNIVNYSKQYGLVWENKPEQIEEELKTKLPVLKELKEKAIINDTEEENYPNHLLIEGDNLHALTTLTFTHEKRIDIIYIDPPYNTGNKDFIYNDTFVDKEDRYRHSKWLSFMEKRLKIAKRLLSERGIIFISIDDNELAQLKLLCDEIFDEQNLLGIVTVAKGTTTGQDAKKFGSSVDYLLVYAKPDFLIGKIGLSEKDKKRFKRKDEKGLYSILQWRKTGNGDKREDRPNLFYPLIAPDGTEIFPYHPSGYESRWRGNKKHFNKLLKENKIEWIKKDNEWKPYVKYYLEGRGKNPSNLWTDIDGNKKATIELKEIFGEKIFNNPKPTDLIKKCLEIVPNTYANVLDFFAGSGTTLQAVIEKNDEDEGKRRCILSTNNENNICKKITYERARRLITGIKIKREPLPNNNLRYFKCDFVERKPSLKNKKELTKFSTDLLCVKEKCYYDVTSELNNEKWNKLFTNRENLYTYVVYDDLHIEQAVEDLTNFIENKTEKPKIKVYVFSNGQYPYTEDFEDILEYVELCALPDVIYQAYQNILPKIEKL